MKQISVRKNKYNSRRVISLNSEPTRTQQQFKNDVNVNNIMKKYHRTREITHLNSRQGKYADISTAQDYFDSMNVISNATSAFNQLPSDIRKRFHNDPGALLEFIHNPENYDEAVKLGIFTPKEPTLTPQSPSPSPAPSLNDDLNDESKTPSSKKK